MANLKNITELPVAESADGLNLIVNDNGSAKQIAASEVGAQADWAETDETSPAFIKNKPVEELDLDATVEFITSEENVDMQYTVNFVNYASLKSKITNGMDINKRLVVKYNNPANTGYGYGYNRCSFYYYDAFESEPEAVHIDCSGDFGFRLAIYSDGSHEMLDI